MRALRNSIIYFLLFLVSLIIGIILSISFSYQQRFYTNTEVTPLFSRAIKDRNPLTKNSRSIDTYIFNSFSTYSNPYRDKKVRSYSNGEIPVPILMYHHIGPIPQNAAPNAWQYYVPVEEFNKQMTYLYLAGYNVISIDTLLSGLEGKLQLPEKPVVITMDDLNPDQIENGLPILKKYNFKATFFLNVNRAFNDDSYVKAILNDGHEIGSHSYNHIILTKLNENQLRFEIEESKRYLQNKYGVTIKYFAYPGCLYNSRVEQIVSNAGYVAALSCSVPYNGKKFSDRYHLGRRLITLEYDKFIARLEDREKVW